MRDFSKYWPKHSPDRDATRHTASGSVSTGRTEPVTGRRLDGTDAPVRLVRRGAWWTRVSVLNRRTFPKGCGSQFRATPEMIAALKFKWGA